jgi:hypothetical protein
MLLLEKEVPKYKRIKGECFPQYGSTLQIVLGQINNHEKIIVDHWFGADTEHAVSYFKDIAIANLYFQQLCKLM